MATSGSGKLKVLLIADLSKKSGLGHWMRCYRLVEGLHQLGHDIHCLQSEFMRQFDYFMPVDFIHWHGCDYALESMESLALIEILQELHQFDALIIDGYQFTADYRQRLKTISPLVICFDDINDCKQYYCDLLINSDQQAGRLNYQLSAKQAELWLGQEYRCLAEIYLRAGQRMAEASNWADRNALTIMMGGADTHSMTLPLLQSLDELQWQPVRPTIQVVTTDLYPGVSMLEQWLAHHDSIVHIHQQYDLTGIYLTSRLVVTTASTSAYEAQACASPALLIILEDNQRLCADSATEAGYGDSFDWQAQPDMIRLAERVKMDWQDTAQLARQHQRLCFDLGRSRTKSLAHRLADFLSRKAHG